MKERATERERGSERDEDERKIDEERREKPSIEGREIENEEETLCRRGELHVVVTT